MSQNKSLIDLSKETQEFEQKILEAEGEITPEIEKSLAELTKDLANKVDNYEMLMKGLEARTELFRMQSQRFTKAAISIDNLIERLRDNIKIAMTHMNVTELQGNFIKWKLSSSNSKLVIDDQSLIPEKYKKVEISIDKAKVKDALKDGETVPGARLEVGVTLRSNTSLK
jgi:hypothetical protein